MFYTSENYMGITYHTCASCYADKQRCYIAGNTHYPGSIAIPGKWPICAFYCDPDSYIKMMAALSILLFMGVLSTDIKEGIQVSYFGTNGWLELSC